MTAPTVMTAARSRILLASLALVPLLGARASAAAVPRDPAIRDLRPTQIHRGDRVTVEASWPAFVVGAPARVVLDQVAPDGQPLSIEARAATPTTVIFDADEALAARVSGLRYVTTSATVTQDAGGRVVALHSSPAAPFELDLFPASLQSMASEAGGRVPWIPGWLVAALVILGAALLIAIPVPVIGGLVVVWERKLSAYMQSRIGPNRVGPNGWFQWIADGVKLIIKEDVIPAEADPVLFRISPFFAFVGLFLVFMVLPFSSWLIAADLDIGLLFILSVTSLVVVGIIMGGWSSNSKWSLLGGMRSAAQIISYELPASIALLGVATLTGSLSTQSIVRAQGGLPWDWYMFRNPFLFVAFFIYYIAALAEGNRTPFDLPEAESELVSGFATEYSGFRYAIYPLVEWVNVFVIGAITAMLFCGGWQVPFVSNDRMDASGWWQLAGFSVYLVKVVFFIFVTIWIRWTLPRFRVDQMMNLCWKYLIPIAFACFVGTLAWAWLVPAPLQKWSPVLWFALLGLWPASLFLRRVRYSRSNFTHFTTNAMFER